jgi:hypothetical protein
MWLAHQGRVFILLAPVIACGSNPRSVLAAPVPVDLSGYRTDCGVGVSPLDGGRLKIEWPMGDGDSGRLVLDTTPGAALVESLSVVADSPGTGPDARPVLERVEPVYFVTVGTRSAPPGRPPGMSVFNVFFDSPAQRPHQTYRAKLDVSRVRVTSEGCRASVILDGLTAGPFAGSLHLTVYPSGRLVHIEAVVGTNEERRAFLYDAGLATDSPSWTRFAWRDTEGRIRRADLDPKAADQPVAVRHRILVAESPAGSVACFPPPHQFFFARDLTDNLRNVWFGRGHRSLDDRFGFGVRQPETGGGSYVPWYNAPPGTDQRLGVFYLLTRGGASDALREALRYTHRDRFPRLPGYSTFTSHWHMEIALAAMKEQAKGAGRTTPDLVRVFKGLGVDIVHLAEFHGEGHQGDPGPIRWPEMKAMFDECRRLSDGELLLLPGEEVSGILGVARPGQHPGHWMCLFPRPVYWAQRRAAGAPFAEEVAPYGTVYRVGSAEDMARLLEREHGLAWTSHPRIKASSWAPDAFRDRDYYKADFWLGAAWKGMPVDLSRPRLGERALDLLDDMTGWGPHKYLVGEVDVFKIDRTHELYGHMNINYVRLARPPRFDEPWRPVLDALRAGRFFVTTGEVLVHQFTAGGKESGEPLALSAGERPEVRLDVEWTFPLRFAELVSGDGSRVYRERIDLSDTGPFGRRTLTARPDLRGRKWVRAEAWDVAGNGAFTQPVWIEGGL